jgi:hypothetical protein
VITLIGYNFDNLNPAPERDRANSALAPFGLAYQGGYFGDIRWSRRSIPDHPVSEDIADVNFNGGIDAGRQREPGHDGPMFATYQGIERGPRPRDHDDGGRVIVWGDEWITFDSGVAGLRRRRGVLGQHVRLGPSPQDICALPQ